MASGGVWAAGRGTSSSSAVAGRTRWAVSRWEKLEGEKSRGKVGLVNCSCVEIKDGGGDLFSVSHLVTLGIIEFMHI